MNVLTPPLLPALPHTESTEMAATANLSITIEDGVQLTAPTIITLAALYAAHELGSDWDEGISPFDEHDTMWSYIEEVQEQILRDKTLAAV